MKEAKRNPQPEKKQMCQYCNRIFPRRELNFMSIALGRMVVCCENCLKDGMYAKG